MTEDTKDKKPYDPLEHNPALRAMLENDLGKIFKVMYDAIKLGGTTMAQLAETLKSFGEENPELWHHICEEDYESWLKRLPKDSKMLTPNSET